MITPERLTFLMNAVGDPNVGALTMSSTYVTRTVLRALPARTNTIVEQGAGTGALTRLLLDRLPPEGRLYAVERSPAFVELLSAIDDPRLSIVQQSAEDVRYESLDIRGGVDAVISSIPFTFLEPDDRRTIVAAAHEALRPGGVFAVFHQYSLLMRSYLRERFPGVRATFEPRNVFPCFILQAYK